jgi:CubicO group peptidase (beta-lactamase class C family)
VTLESLGVPSRRSRPSDPTVRPVTAFRGTTGEHFAPVARAFARLIGRGPGGGAVVVRLRGETVVDLSIGSADAAGRRPWTPDTLGLSFSTTKGVASTVIHRLADRGALDYDEPVATYWPEFAAGGKHGVSVRDVLTHRAGLSSVRAVASSAEDLLDHIGMEERLAARATRAPTNRSAYHAITYGWLVAGIARRVTGGHGLAELVKTEIADPLGVPALHIGVKHETRDLVAEPVGAGLRQIGSAVRVFSPMWTRARRTRAAIEALVVPGFHRLFEGAEPPIWNTEMPAVNGAFSADALARMYGALANAGCDDGTRLLSPQTTDALGRVQVRTADAVLGMRMRWRLGYHQAFGTGRDAPAAFGHYGYGGSGGWADPDLGLSLGFVTNRVGSLTTPLGDLNLYRLSRVVRRCALRALVATGERPSSRQLA